MLQVLTSGFLHLISLFWPKALLGFHFSRLFFFLHSSRLIKKYLNLGQEVNTINYLAGMTTCSTAGTETHS